MTAGCSSSEDACAGPEEPAGRAVRDRHDVRPADAYRVAGADRRRELQRLEADERRLAIERRLQEVHLRLQQIALRLRDEEARREPRLVAAPLDVEALLGERRAGARRLFALRGASHLPRRLADRLR